MESLNLASKLYKTDFFRMKCSTQDSSTKRSKTMTNQRVSKQVLVSISMLKKDFSIGISCYEKSSEICFMIERHLPIFSRVLKVHEPNLFGHSVVREVEAKFIEKF